MSYRSLRAALALFALVLGLLPGPAAAYDRIRIDPSIVVRQQYDSNVFNRERDVQHDVSTLVTPDVRIASESDTRNVSLRYRLTARKSYEFSDLDSVQHLINFNARQNLSRRLSVNLGSAIRILPKTSNVEDGGTEFQTGRPDVKTYNFNTGASYVLTPRSSASLSLSFGKTDVDDSGDGNSTQFDSKTRQAALSYRYTLSPRDVVSTSLIQSFSEFEPNGSSFILAAVPVCELFGIPAPGIPLSQCRPPEQGLQIGSTPALVDAVATNENRQTVLNTSWRRVWNSRWTSSLTLGVRTLKTKTDDRTVIPIAVDVPPVLAGSETETSFTFVGGFDIDRKGRDTDISFSYNRTTRPSTAEAGAVDVDIFRLEFVRRLTRALTARFTTIYAYRESANSQLTQEVENWQYRVHLGYKLSRHWTAFVDASYRDQDSSGTRVRSTSFDGYKASLGFTYRFPVDLFTTGGAHVRRGI